jgi:titin
MSKRLVVPAAIAAAIAIPAAALASWTATSSAGAGKTAGAALNAPGAGTATGASSTTMTVSWAAPSAGVPASKLGYQVFRGTSAGGESATALTGGCSSTTIGSSTSCTDDAGLSGGTTYFYFVKATVGNNWLSAHNTEFSGSTTSAVFAPDNLGSTTSCSSGLSASNHVCGGPSITTTSGRTELILVNLTGSNSTSTTISSVSGPFSGTPTLISGASKAYSSTGRSYVFAYQATGSGSVSAQQVSVTFDAGTNQGTGFIEVVELGANNSVVKAATGAGATSGGGKTFTVSNINPNSTTDSEVIWLGTTANTAFSAPTGKNWQSIVSATNHFGSFSNSTVQAEDQTWSQGNANNDWAYITLEIKLS